MGRNMSDFPIPASIELISRAMINETKSFQIFITYRLDLPLQQFQDISSKNHIPACHPKWVGHLGTIMHSLSNLDAVVGHLLTSTTWTKWTSASITTIIATVLVVAESSIACASAVACTACENPRATTPCGNSRAAISYRTLRVATACWDPRPLSPTRIPGPSLARTAADFDSSWAISVTISIGE